jgi:hypothetical protein
MTRKMLHASVGLGACAGTRSTDETYQHHAGQQEPYRGWLEPETKRRIQSDSDQTAENIHRISENAGLCILEILADELADGNESKRDQSEDRHHDHGRQYQGPQGMRAHRDIGYAPDVHFRSRTDKAGQIVDKLS